jgi:hypothetical protein
MSAESKSKRLADHFSKQQQLAEDYNGGKALNFVHYISCLNSKYNSSGRSSS